MKKVILALLFLALFLLPFLNALTAPNPSIQQSNPTTSTALECIWTDSGDATQTNVSWYKNGLQNQTETNVVGTLSTLSSIYTTRGEIWHCIVNITNSTSIIVANDSVEIKNEKPSDPILYKNGSLIINTTNVTEDNLYSFDINSTDNDGDSLTYSSNGSYFTVNSGTGSFTWTPTQAQVAEKVQFQVQDGQDPSPGISALNILFNIIYINDSPTWVTSITDQNATEDISFVYNIEVADEENDQNNFYINVSPSLPTLVLNKIDGFNANITFNRSGNYPVFSEKGNYTVNITVYDVNNASRNLTSSFNLEISAVNQIPNMTTILNASGTEGQQFIVWINSTDGDINDTQTFSISVVGCGLNDPWSISTVNNSNNASGLINLTLNNDHVICPDVNVTVQDNNGASVWQVVNFNIINTNEYPVIYNLSYYGSNNVGNNLSNLSGSKGALLTYTVNATDNDSLTYEGEVLTYAVNNSIFVIDSSSGVINFTGNNSHVGNNTINLTVTDDEGLVAWTLMQFEVKNNTIPQLDNLINTSCQEDQSCIIVVTATDPDSGANLTISSNSSVFTFTYLNNTAAIYLGTLDNSYVGNYSVLISVNDEVGAGSSRVFNISLNNTNDPPIFDGNQDNVSDNVSIGLIVETFNFVMYINITDEDLIYGDVLTFSYSTLFGNTSVFNLTQYNSYQAIINFTPTDGNAGNYSINISVNDSDENMIWQVVNFSIENKSVPPTINDIRPYNNGSEAVFSFGTNTFGKSMVINFSENRTVTFDVNATDPDGDDMNYTWTVNGVSNGTGRPNIIDFDFSSNGTYNIKVVVNDPFFEQTDFQWNVTVTNLNRAPELSNPLANLTSSLTVNGTTTYSNYFSKFTTLQRFYDPDDDLDNSTEIDNNESLRLTYSASSCVDQVTATVATFSYTSSSLTATPVKLGSCLVIFTATDEEGLTVSSNNVSVNVSQLNSNNGGESTTVVTTSGGRSTNTIVIPLTQEVEEPAPLRIITPGEVVAYHNRVMIIPIRIESNWTETLLGISLEVSSNNSEIELNLSENYFPQLSRGESHNLTIEVRNFREGGPYEIYVKGTVERPVFEDTEIILINSIEAADSGESYETKISFARDFFDQNKECQELNEVLKKAEERADELDFEEAILLVDAAINGCKYLVSNIATPETQNPSYVRTLREFTKENVLNIIIGSGALLIIALGIFFTRKSAFD